MGFHQSRAWQKLRLQALRRDGYLCQWCLRKGVYKRAEEVHHIVRVKEDASQALTLDNLVSLCWECHKTTRIRRRAADAQQSAAKTQQLPDGVRVIRID